MASLIFAPPDFSIGDQHSTRPSHFGLQNCLTLLKYTRMFGHKDNTITFLTQSSWSRWHVVWLEEMLGFKVQYSEGPGTVEGPSGVEIVGRLQDKGTHHVSWFSACRVLTLQEMRGRPNAFSFWNTWPPWLHDLTDGQSVDSGNS